MTDNWDFNVTVPPLKIFIKGMWTNLDLRSPLSDETEYITSIYNYSLYR